MSNSLYAVVHSGRRLLKSLLDLLKHAQDQHTTMSPHLPLIQPCQSHTPSPRHKPFAGQWHA